MVSVLSTVAPSLKATEATPLPPVSVAEAEKLMVALYEPTDGAVMDVAGPVLSTLTLVIKALMNVLPALSVVVTRRSYRPSVKVVVFQVAEYGLVVSVEIVVQVLAPAVERAKIAEATPEPPLSAESEVMLTALPFTMALAAGAVMEPVGLVLSTVTTTPEEVVVLPDGSRAVALMVWEPSATPVVFQEMENGLVVSSAPWLTPSTLNWTPETVPELSLAVAERLTAAPRTLALLVGALMETVGGVVSGPALRLARWAL
jgi:hypothetical protein